MKARVRRCSLMGLLLVWCVLLGISSLASGLPYGRHYEMVSPPYKAGYGVQQIEAVAAGGRLEGERVTFGSLGLFNGEPSSGLSDLYDARRGASGWLTGPLGVPVSVSPATTMSDLSPSLEVGLYIALPGTNAGAAEADGLQGEFWLHHLEMPDLAEYFQLAGMPLKRLDGKPFIFTGSVASSRDFCHIMFYTTGTQALLLEALGTNSFLYELRPGGTVEGCGEEEPSLKLVGVGNVLGPNREPKVLDPYCITFLGASTSSEGTVVNAVAADGSEIFFQANTNLTTPGCDGEFVAPSDPSILFVRLNGEKTVEVSTPIASDCQASAPCHSAKPARAEFVAADETGTHVFFLTAQPLVTSDTDNDKDVYMAKIGCPATKPECAVAQREVTSLVQVSHGSEPAEVQGVAVVSPNGERVYFVAHGVLGGANGNGDVPVSGADNLYMYEVNGAKAGFVADLCSGPERSGEVADLQCPASLTTGGEGGEHAGNDVGLWRGNDHEVQTTDDGRFLVFASYGKLVKGDTDSGRDIYRYDVEAGSLERVSLGEEGYKANGNGEGFSAGLPIENSGGRLMEEHELSSRIMSEDGSRIVFSTREPLSPDAINGLVNAYEWRKEADESGEGHVSLLSSGSDEESITSFGGRGVVMTPSGRDIFFRTVQGLLPQDTDGAEDVYDARLGPGFPPQATGPGECEGEACRGPLTSPVPILIPASASTTPAESAPAARAAPKKKAKKRGERKRKHGVVRHVSVRRRVKNSKGRGG
jgi:hypothetical protein